MKTRNAKLVLAIGIALSSPKLYAAGFQLSEHSAAGLGRANAGEAAIADGASVVAHNPAAITMFDSYQLSVGAAYIMPEVRVTGNGPSESFNNQLTNNDVVDNVVVPSFYIAAPINDSWSWGLGIFTDFGLATEYPDDYLAGPIGGETSLETINFNPTIAYRINDEFSVGVGASIVYGKAKLTRTLGILADAINADTGANFARTDIAKSLDGDGWGYGFNLGALWEINGKHRFGLSYRSKVDVDFEGDYYSDIPSAISMPGETVTGDLTLNLPSITEFSGFHQITDPLAIHYSVMMTGWDVFEEIRATVDGQEVLQKDENFENAFKYAFGATYQLNPSFTLRAGIAYDETPNVNDKSISLPDSDRINYSFGATYAFNQNSRIDFGFTFIDAEEVTFTEPLEPHALPGVDIAYRSEGDAYIYGIQYNHSF
ncbi:outer membrane protein transport protein [Vibrio harveyi]|uniref:outer membrane protein transport protein n=1 Tax=Vibrio harveyi TaxID=669 RepID=UPI000680B9B8|nr:outer membrane protein transport protein [Vibrio harveyi]EKO3843203.1 outer membrane protein transport protein [Vibrio harveyi]MCQ9071925.1 outer membrane protein transport protein [Vibrio harveyi]HDM8188682.1 outer membrane protein transport protein [Vibrio harveyi]